MIHEPKIIIGNPLLDKWAYYDNKFDILEDNNGVLFETPLSKLMQFVKPDEILLCGSGNTLISVIEGIRKTNE